MTSPSIGSVSSPVTGATYTDGKPRTLVYVANYNANSGAGVGWKMTHQFDTSAGFGTGNLVTYEQSTNENKILIPVGSFSASDHQDGNPATALASNVWYYRVKVTDKLGNVSAWSSTVGPFTVGSIPTTHGWQPTGAVSLGDDGTSPAFAWEFDNAIGAPQAGFTLVVKRASDDLQIINTAGTEVANPNHYYVSSTTFATIEGLGYFDTLMYWYVTVTDTNGTSSLASAHQQFYMRNLPTVVLTSPTISIGSPGQDVAWTFTASDSRTQAAYRIDVYRDPSLPTTDIANLVFSTGWLAGSATTYSFPSTFVFVNGWTYTIVVSAQDSTNLVGTDTDTFDATWPVPAAPLFVYADATQHEYSGCLNIIWENTVRDPDFLGYRVYRKGVDDDDSLYVMLAELTAEFINATQTFHDYTVPIATEVTYAVTQIADTTSTGVAVDSELTSTVTVSVNTDKYWLSTPYDPDLESLAVGIAPKSDNFAEVYETAEIALLGRGRRKEFGTRYGYEGTLTADVRDEVGMTAREKRLAFETLKAARRTLIFRNPFGDIFYVAANDITFDRLPGVGKQEFGTLTIPYSEVVA